MGWVGARALEGVGVTSFQALLAPLLVDSYELEAAVFEEGIAEQMLADITEQMLADGDEAGLTGIAVLPGPLRKMMGIAQPFTAPADFADQVVGYSGGPLAERSLEALGAQPQLVAGSTPLEGLDALDYHLAAIYGNFYFEQADYVTGNLNVWPRPVVVVMNADVFATLSADHQAALREAGVAASGGALEASSAGEAEAASGLCNEGMTVADRDRGRPRRAAGRLRPGLLRPRGEPVDAGVPRRDSRAQGGTGCAGRRGDLPGRGRGRRG